MLICLKIHRKNDDQPLPQLNFASDTTELSKWLSRVESRGANIHRNIPTECNEASIKPLLHCRCKKSLEPQQSATLIPALISFARF